MWRKRHRRRRWRKSYRPNPARVRNRCSDARIRPNRAALHSAFKAARNSNAILTMPGHTVRRRVLSALLIGLGFYALSDILLLQRIFKAHQLSMFDPQ